MASGLWSSGDLDHLIWTGKAQGVLLACQAFQIVPLFASSSHALTFLCSQEFLALSTPVIFGIAYCTRKVYEQTVGQATLGAARYGTGLAQRSWTGSVWIEQATQISWIQ